MVDNLALSPTGRDTGAACSRSIRCRNNLASSERKEGEAKIRKFPAPQNKDALNTGQRQASALGFRIYLLSCDQALGFLLSCAGYYDSSLTTGLPLHHRLPLLLASIPIGILAHHQPTSFISSALSLCLLTCNSKHCALREPGVHIVDMQAVHIVDKLTLRLRAARWPTSRHGLLLARYHRASVAHTTSSALPVPVLLASREALRDCPR